MPALLLIWLAVLSTLSSCSTPPAEQPLRDTIAAMQQAAEARDVDGVIDAVHASFSGSHGLDRDQLHRVLRLAMLRNTSVGVTLGPLDVAVDGERATVRFVAMTTGGQGGWIPERARGYRVVTEWRFEDGDWLLQRADWADE